MQLEQISDGAAVNPPYVDGQGRQYPPNIATLFTDAQLAALGWRRRAPAAPTKDALKAHASRLRRQKEASGVLVDVAAEGEPEMLVLAATDVAGQMAISGAVQLVQIDPARMFLWVTSAGSVELSGAQILKIGVTVGAFVQATYATLGEIYEGIDAEGLTTFAEIDAYEWPGE